MMPYQHNKAVNRGQADCVVRGKTAIVTGGANGIGESYTRALVEAGAFVVIGDLNAERGAKLKEELDGKVEFVQCNVLDWEAQVALFDKALAASPSSRIDIVIPNAGIDGADTVFFTDPEEKPSEPSLDILRINLIGALYTIRLALHWFRRQAATSGVTAARCHDLIIQGSLAGYLDLPGALEYSASKFALRGVMRDLRKTEWQHSIRVNYIGPWFVRTGILAEAAYQHLESCGVEFARVDDASSALMHVLTNSRVIGRSIAIVPRSIAACGYIDVESDEYEEGSVLKRLQDMVEIADNRSEG